LIADVQDDVSNALAEEIRRVGGTAEAAHVDVADRASVEEIPAHLARAFAGMLDLLVCNAGVQTFQHAALVTDAEWQRVLDVNAKGTFLAMQMASGAMAESRSMNRTIVSVASIQARLGSPFYPHYSASKAAVLSLTRSFALTLAPSGVRVNAVAPGVIDTPLWAQADAALSGLRGVPAGTARADRIASVPLGRAGTPDDVAAAVSFLASSDSSYITGECLHVCGGDVML